MSTSASAIGVPSTSVNVPLIVIVSNALTAENGVLTNATAEYSSTTVTLTPVDGSTAVVITNPNSKGNWRLVDVTVYYEEA